MAALFPECFCPQNRTLKQRKILVKGHNKKPNKLTDDFFGSVGVSIIYCCFIP